MLLVTLLLYDLLGATYAVYTALFIVLVALISINVVFRERNKIVHK